MAPASEASDEPEQEALFAIERPDEDSCVWIVIGEGEEAIVANLGRVRPSQ